MRRPRLPVRSAPDRCHCIPSRWPRLLLENSLHHAGADTELPADLEDAVAAGLQFENLRGYFGLKPAPAQFRLSPSRAASRRGIRPSSPPAFGIGQRAILARTPAGNVLWDCLALIDDATVDLLKGMGGVAAIAISHPHYYTTMVEWSRALGGAPIYLHAADSQWVMRAD